MGFNVAEKKLIPVFFLDKVLIFCKGRMACPLEPLESNVWKFLALLNSFCCNFNGDSDFIFKFVTNLRSNTFSSRPRFAATIGYDMVNLNDISFGLNHSNGWLIFKCCKRGYYKIIFLWRMDKQHFDTFIKIKGC